MNHFMVDKGHRLLQNWCMENQFCGIIRELRNFARLSQRDLAVLAKVSPTTIVNLESRGREDARDATVSAVGQALLRHFIYHRTLLLQP